MQSPHKARSPPSTNRKTRRSPAAPSRSAGARLIFFDNVYMYGKVAGAMTEDTPFNPVSRKGEIRARIATSLINEWKAGRLTAMIARAADFYGPNAKTGIPNVMVFDPMSKR